MQGTSFKTAVDMIAINDKESWILHYRNGIISLV